jgi:hypothetical protein
MAEENDLASIVTDYTFIKWRDNILKPDDPYSVFHARYWGVSMQEEKRAWHADNPDFEPPSKEMSMDVDGDENHDHGQDYITGCYALNVQPLWEDKLWICAEYMGIFDYIVNFFKGGKKCRTQAAVVTGQLGISEFCQV